MCEYYVVIDRDEEGQYVAYVPELPGCQTCADKIDELTTNIREAIDLYLAVALWKPAASRKSVRRAAAW